MSIKLTEKQRRDSVAVQRLVRCRSCGGKPKTGIGFYRHWVECDDCEARGPSVSFHAPKESLVRDYTRQAFNESRRLWNAANAEVSHGRAQT